MKNEVSTKSWPVVLLALALLLFFCKQGIASKPERLPWQTEAQSPNPGRITYTDAGDSYQAFFYQQPVPVLGLGWTAPLTTTAIWHIRCDRPGGEVITIEASPKDTITFLAGDDVFVTCSVRYTFEAIPPKTGSVVPFSLKGKNPVDCIQLISPISVAPSDDTQLTIPVNSCALDAGVISLQGQAGVLVVFNYQTMTPITAVEFSGGLIYDLKQTLGSGMYMANAIFSNPPEVVEIGVVNL